MPLRPVIVAAALPFAACALPAPPDPRLADEVAALLCGTFSSEAQHREAPDDYLWVRLVVVPVWPWRDDGPWLYVEQAERSALQRPYRQRVYRLVPLPDGAVRSDVHLLPGEPLAWSAAWREPRPLADVTPADLTLREGCSVVLRRSGDRWVGATDGRDCESRRAGAAWATSEVVLTEDRLLSWDRGFDAAGGLVWGPRDGPYRLDKLSSHAPD